MTALSEPTPTPNPMTSDEDNDVMNLTLRPARRSFLIDSLLEERQKQLQSSEASTASPPSNEQTEGEQSDSESPQIESSSDLAENIHAPTSVPLSMPSTPVAAMPPQPGNLNFFQALARLMATNQTALMSQNAAARFRMMNLSAMAPSLAAFGQVQQQSVTAAQAFRGMMGPIRPDMGQDSPLTRLLGAGRPNLLNSMATGGSSRSYPPTSASGSGGSSTAGSVRSSNVKKYRCDVCEKTFSRSNTLITHKRIHTGEKPFRCEHCGRAFRQPGNLTRHRLTHTTDKPFVCMECGKAFNRASNLHTHTRTHAPTPARLHLGF
uniref:Protein krueppel n=1 Tax=Panagrellus redivivus TaxID=6233 RepID=A0A7E4UM56_PANRE